MAIVYDVKLTLEQNKPSKAIKVTVSYKLKLSKLEELTKGLLFKEDISLWGSDAPHDEQCSPNEEWCPPYEDGIDDKLYNFSTKIIHVPPYTFERSVILGEDVLDEDSLHLVPVDEIYALVCVTPVISKGSCSKSNIVKAEIGQ
ncbi:MAG: hypothetical protein CDV28_12039 [Candidatus Electronema aureum]|uniref:Uncharacterized protein n=1 Tax=Candidatus Electronema aureum TaxID=2005002 RepID=A0A521G0Y2_9BACT|nr:MAG: hypothetical protein CDV28_12039 [Candidatus Electronema aureum]